MVFTTLSTWHIHISGQVQGVGFRPFVYKLAKMYGLKGWVNNTSDGIHIEFNADEEYSKKFYEEVLSKAPSLALIVSHGIHKRLQVSYEDFQIVSSSNKGNTGLLLSPDFAMCKDCSEDIMDNTNRRYQYAFTTCTKCGPRFSIVRELPYDRVNTSMNVFNNCSRCNTEYHDPVNRRHFSQTNSCPDCPVEMKLFDSRKQMIEDDQAKIIYRICECWNNGSIVAIKGIGGYLLTCDASNQQAIELLRKRKHRPIKPFALMFPDMDLIAAALHANEAEITELSSPPAPIVLLQLKYNNTPVIAGDVIAPGLSTVGAMLPYTPLYRLLLKQFAKPIVATSGNISNAPIVSKDESALTELNILADQILVHNREIVTAQDDSVVAYSRYAKHRIVIRRARGFAPLFEKKQLKLPESTVLATGAMLKSCFSLLHHQNIHVSQYLGDSDNYDVQNNYEEALLHLLHLFDAHPEIIVADLHPGYFPSQFGEQLAKQWSSKLVHVQHHEAHFASVLGEHHLLDDGEAILGVVWDGTGLGLDRQIWGGEFFTFNEKNISRVAHFDYFSHFLGDKMSVEPRLAAFSLCYESTESLTLLHPKFSPEEWMNYNSLIKKEKLQTSSVGRIFDAVAALLGLIDKASFEGEAALLLEEEALRYFNNKLIIPESWLGAHGSGLHSHYLIKQVSIQVQSGIDKPAIAAWFHVQLVMAVQQVATNHHCHKICFSGGVFQNGLLIDLLLLLLGNKYQLFFNKSLSPNDENVSFGQLIRFCMNPKGLLNNSRS